RYELRVKKPLFISFCSAGIAFPGILVLFLAADPVGAATKLSCLTHVIIVVRIPKTIPDNAIHYLTVTQPHSATGLRQIIGNIAHALHAASNYHLIFTGPDAGSSQHNGFHT